MSVLKDPIIIVLIDREYEIVLVKVLKMVDICQYCRRPYPYHDENCPMVNRGYTSTPPKPKVIEKDCAFCGGSGGVGLPCRVCGGAGTVLVGYPPQPCRHCSGSGGVGLPCRACHGTGYRNAIRR